MKKFAVMGHPVAHSLSPAIHHAFAKELGYEISYEAIDPGAEGFTDAVVAFREAGGDGLSITMPFKRQADKIAQQRMPAAEMAGVANTLWWDEHGTLFADNTDGLGLIWDLQQRLGVCLEGASVLLIGAGGAVSGVLGNILVEHPAQVIVANRTVEKVFPLFMQQRPCDQNRLRAIDLTETLAEPVDLIIHATSLGHQGQVPLIPEGAIGEQTFCYDLSYGEAAHPFLEWARSHGASACSDGIGMLVAQAALQVERWIGQMPSINKTCDTIRLIMDE